MWIKFYRGLSQRLEKELKSFLGFTGYSNKNSRRDQSEGIENPEPFIIDSDFSATNMAAVSRKGRRFFSDVLQRSVINHSKLILVTMENCVL